MTQNVTLLPPVGGINLKVPLANMDPIYSPYIQNFDSDGTKLKLRRGIRKHCTVNPVGDIAYSLGVYGIYGAGYKLYAWTTDTAALNAKVYDVTSGTASAATTVSDTVSLVYSSNYNSRLWFASGSTAALTNIVFDGTSWTAPTFTYNGSAFGWRIIHGYKSRGYLFLGQSAAGSEYYYTNTVGGVAGACSKVNLGTIFSTNAGLAFITSFSMSDGVTNEEYIAFGDMAGEVAIYSGDYPGSASWRIVNKFQIGLPVDYQAVIKYQNDALIMTTTGLVSLRNLFINGENSAFINNISEPIDSMWIQMATNNASLFFNVYPRTWSGAYWVSENKIVIAAYGGIDSEGNYTASVSTFFVLDCASKAWTIYTWVHDGGNVIANLTYFDKKLYFVYGSVVMKISMASSVPFYDSYAYSSSDNNYPFKVYGAYQSLNDRSVNKKIEGFELLMRGDVEAANFGMLCASDFGRQVSSRAKVDIQPQTSVTDGFNRVKYSVGADGVFYQYRLEGTSTSVPQYGMEIYSIVTLFNPGGNR